MAKKRIKASPVNTPDRVKLNGKKVKEFINEKGENMHSLSKKKIGVEYKTIQRMAEGKNVSISFVEKLADYLDRDISELIDKVDDKEGHYVIAKKIESMNDLYQDGKYGLCRKIGEHQNLISLRKYECSPDKQTKDIIFKFIDIFYSRLHFTEAMDDLKSSLEVESKHLDNVANVEEYINYLNNKKISIFYCTYAHRYIDSVKFLCVDYVDVGVDYPERQETEKLCLVPTEKKIEFLIFKFQEIPSLNLKVKIPEGYTREDLKNEYLKVFKEEANKHSINSERAEERIKDISFWIDYQNKYTNWFYTNQQTEGAIEWGNELPGQVYMAHINEEQINKFKYNSSNIQTDISIEEINFIKKKEGKT